MNDAAAKLASRLACLDTNLSTVLSVHLFTECLLDELIDRESVIASRLKDRRVYTFAVKLALVFHMGLLDKALFDNLVALNSLRNQYAHQIDVDLARSIGPHFVRRDSTPLFADLGETQRAIRDDPEGARRVLLEIRDVTFAWLDDVARRRASVR